MNKPRILAIIPCRAGSKRLKNKNILPINGKPMYEWTLEMVKKSKLIYDCYFSTDIIELYHPWAIMRPPELCTDESPLDDSLRYTLKEVERLTEVKFDYIVMCHCNIPIRKDGEIDKLIQIALKNPNATSVATCTKANIRPEWCYEQDGKYAKRFMQSDKFRNQDFKPLFKIDGSIEVIRTDVLMKATGKCMEYFGDNIILVEHEPEFGQEVDTIDDLNYVKYLMNNRKST